MQKTRKKIFAVIGLLFIAICCMFIGIKHTPTYAISYRTPKYITDGKTKVGDTTYLYSLEKFTVYMKSSHTDGTTETLSDNKMTAWGNYVIAVEAIDIRHHVSFKLTRNGYTYVSNELDGDDEYLSLYSGSLPDGSYALEYIANVGNLFSNDDYIYTFNFRVDNTNPSLTLKEAGKSVSSGRYTNKQMDVVVEDSNFSYLKYKSPGMSSYATSYSKTYTVSATASHNGWWYFYALDYANNVSGTYSFCMDTIAPVGTVVDANGRTISNGGYTNSAISYTATDELSGVISYYVKTPGSSSWESYTAGTYLTPSYGWTTFKAMDRTSNYSEEYSVYYDNEKPTGTVYGGTTAKSSGSYTNAEYVKYEAFDNYSGINKCYVLKPGASSYVEYTRGSQLTDEGTYTFFAQDYSLNESDRLTITLDKTKPIGKIYADGKEISSGSYTSAAKIEYKVTDNISVGANYVKKPGDTAYKEYTLGTTYSAEGTYYFYTVDRTSSQSEIYTVTIDKTIPTGIIYGEGSSLTNGSYTNAQYITYTPSDNFGVSESYVKKPGESSYLKYVLGTKLTEEGQFYFYSVDHSKLESAKISVIVDKTAPVGQLYAGTKAVANGTVINADYVKFTATDNYGVSKMYVKTPSSSSFTSYTSGTQFTAEGTYQYYAEDLSQNESEIYTITIDRKVPKAQLYVDGNPIMSNSYTNGAHIYFECEEQCFVKRPDSTEFIEYVSGTEYYKAGKYIFYGVSGSGTSTGYYIVVIDRTIKTVELENVFDGKTDGDVVIAWTDGDSNLYAPIKSVTINGKAYTKDTVIYTIDTGNYNVKVVDYAGNEWQTQFSSTKKNIVTDALQKEYFEAYDKDGNYYAFSTYDKALDFAKARENGYVRTGEWKSASWDTGIAMDSIDSVNAKNGTYYIYKKSNNPSVEVAYFTTERLNAVITEYAKVGINSYYYWEKEPLTIAQDENLFAYSDRTYTVLGNSITLGDNIRAFLNDEEYTEKVINLEGKHTLTIADEYLNTCKYTLYVVKSVPSINYSVKDGNVNTVTYDRTYYFKDKVSVGINDLYDEMAMFSVYDEHGALIEHFGVNERYEITNSGSYSVKAVNHAGQSNIFNLVISLNAPKVKIENNTQEKQLKITITKSTDDESNIQTLEIFKSIDGGKTWQLLLADDYGESVSIYKHEYRFRTTGMYKVVLTDEFHTGIDAVTSQYDYIQETPVGILIGVENGGYTNDKVIFTWQDEAVVTLKKDGETVNYESGKEIVEDGIYTLTFENFDGYKEIYNFTIDTLKPIVDIEGAEHRESVKNDVKVYYTEENLTAELFKNGKSLGEYTSGNPVSADGKYRIVIKDLANNQVEVEFIIDKTVDYTINIYENGLSNSVIVTANEDLSVVLVKNDTVVEYTIGGAITEPGDYTITLTDSLGNAETINFKVVEPLVKSFSHNFDNVDGLAGVTVNGENKRLNYGTLELFDDGKYEVGITVSGKTYLFVVTVDNTAPTATLVGVENGGSTKDKVIISDVFEQAQVKLFKDGVEIEYTLGKDIADVGEYKVVLTDLCGNTSEYTFTIYKTLSGGAIAGIVASGLVLIGIVVVIILKKKQVF